MPTAAIYANNNKCGDDAKTLRLRTALMFYANAFAVRAQNHVRDGRTDLMSKWEMAGKLAKPRGCTLSMRFPCKSIEYKSLRPSKKSARTLK